MGTLEASRKEAGGRAEGVERETIRRALDRLEKAGDLVVYYTDDDRGLELEEYEDLVLKVLAILPSPPQDVKASDDRAEEVARLREALGEIIARSRVGKGGVPVARSRHVHYPSSAYFQAVSALTQSPQPRSEGE